MKDKILCERRRKYIKYCTSVAVPVLSGCTSNTSPEATNTHSQTPIDSRSPTSSVTPSNHTTPTNPEVQLDSGTWPTHQVTAARTGYHPNANEPKNAIKKDWTFEIKAENKYQDVGISAPPTATDNTIFISSQNLKLYALDSRTGETKWSFDTGHRAPPSTIYGDSIVTATLNSIDVSSGKEQWSSDAMLSRVAPAVAGGTVYVAEQDMYAIDAASGTIEWKVDLDFVTSEPLAVANNIVYVTGHRVLEARSADTGEMIWEFSLGDRNYFHGNPTIRGSVLYISTEKKTFALNANTGQEIWTVDGGSGESPAVDSDTVYINTASQNFVGLVALDASTGERRWRAPGGFDSSPIVVGSTLYGVTSNVLLAVDANDGTTNWKTTVSGEFSTPPTVVDNHVYVGTPTYEKVAKLYAFTSSSN